MHTTIKATKYTLDPRTQTILEEKLTPLARLLGERAETALLEVEVEEAPPQGRSSEPTCLVARLKVDGDVYHATAVKPTPESAADKVRAELEAEIRKSRGRTQRLIRRGAGAIKDMLRFGR